jgi:hypothetical protein
MEASPDIWVRVLLKVIRRRNANIGLPFVLFEKRADRQDF